MRLCSLLVGFGGLLAGLAACDLPTAPERLNPYDPASGDGRVPTAPDRLTLAAATPTSVTLAWRDLSSFETAVRVERAIVEERFGEPVVEFERVATLPAGATAYTDTDLGDSRPRVYRLVALAGRAESVPSESLAVGPPLEHRALRSSVLAPGDASPQALSADGATLYAWVTGETGVSAFDVRTGARLGRIADATRVAALLADGRVALRFGADYTAPLRVALVRGGTVEQVTDLGSECPTADLTVSLDGGTAAASCGFSDPVAVWRLPSGTRVRSVGTHDTVLRGLSPDGAQVYTVRNNRLAAWSTATGAELWSHAGLPAARVVSSPDGRRLLGLSGSGVALIGAATGATLATDEQGVVQGYGTGAAFSPDGQHVAYPNRGTVNRPPGTRLALAEGLVPQFDLFDPASPPLWRVTGTGLTVVSQTYEGGAFGDIVVSHLDLTQPWRAVPVPVP